MKIVSIPENEVPVAAMPKNSFAVITKWGNTKTGLGEIVMRNDNDLISLQSSKWADVFNDDGSVSWGHRDCFVKLLPKGTVIEL